MLNKIKTDLTYSANVNEVNKALHPNQQKYKTAQFTTNSTIMTFKRDFEIKYKNLQRKSPEILYDKVLKDISVLPVIENLKEILIDIYDNLFKNNMNAIYNNAPASFRTLVDDPALYEYYELRFYLFVMMDYVKNNANSLTNLQGIDKYTEWIRPRDDPNITYYIAGPKDNSVFEVNNVQQHYMSIISPSDTVSEISSYLQLATQQTMSDNVKQVLDFVSTAPNVYTKNPNEQCKYLVSIDSSTGVLVTIDSLNNLKFDCKDVKIGDLDDSSNTARINEITVDTKPRNELSNLSIRTIRDLFLHYGRIKIIDLTFTDSAFISSLNAFHKVFVVFEGIACDERAVYNTAVAPYLKIGGHFDKCNYGYKFIPDADAVTYKPSRVDIKDFKIYITTDPSTTNKIVPNQYTIKTEKKNIYQHPYKTNVIPSEEPEVRVDDYTYDTFEVADNNYENDNLSSKVQTTTKEIILRQVNEILNANLFGRNEYSTLENESIIVMLKNELNNSNDQDLNLMQADVTDAYNKRNQKLITFFNNMITHCEAIISTIDLIISLTNISKSELRAYLVIAFRAYMVTMLNKFEKILKNMKTIKIQEILTMLSTYYSYNVYNVSRILELLIDIQYIKFNFNNIIINRSSTLETLIHKNSGSSLYSSVQVDDPNYGITNEEYRNLYYNSTSDIIQELAQIDLATTTITSDYLYTKFKILLNTIPVDSSVNIIEIYNHYKCWINMLINIISIFKYNKPTSSVIIKQDVKQHIVKIDTATATIDGKYFRIINGKPQFEDSNGKAYTTPDTSFLRYQHVTNDTNSTLNLKDINDLMLINMYKYNGNNNIEHIDNSSYIYSDVLKTIMKLSQTYTDANNITTRLKFDNTYGTNSYNIYPTWESKTFSWTDIMRIYSNDINIYYKTVTLTQSCSEIVEYYAVNKKSNSIILSIAGSDICFARDDNGNYIDILNESEDIKNSYKHGIITIEDLFSFNNDGNLKYQYNSSEPFTPICRKLFSSHVEINNEKGYETKYQAGLLPVIENMFYKYYQPIKQVVYSDNYIEYYNNIINKLEFTKFDNYNINFPNTNIMLTNSKTNFANNLKFVTDIPITGFLSSSEHVSTTFTGFVKSLDQFGKFYLLTGIVRNYNDDVSYTVSIIGKSNTNNPDLIIEFTSEYSINKAIKSDNTNLVVTDYFGNIITVGDNITFNDNINIELDDLSYTSKDNNSNVITTTYSMTTYKKCTEIIVKTNVKNILTSTIIQYNIHVYHDSETGYGSVSYDQINSSDYDSYTAPVLYGIRTPYGTYNYQKIMYEKQTFESVPDTELSNCYKAFKINNYNIINNYWNNNAYEYSVLQAHIPVKYSYTNVPGNINKTVTNNDNTDVYILDSNNNVKYIDGSYTITANGILGENVVNNLYVYTHSQENYTAVINDENSQVMYDNNTIVLTFTDKDNIIKFSANISYNIDTKIVNRFELFAVNKYYNMDNSNTEFYEKSLSIGVLEYNIISGIVFYIDGISSYKCILEYENSASSITITDCVITETISELVHYNKVKNNNRIQQCILPTLMPNNIPGDDIVSSDIIIPLEFTDLQYKIHPCVEYIQNIFSEPRYTNTNGFITLLNAFNQNTQTMNVNIKNENTISNDSIYNVGNIIVCNDNHICESLDDYMLMLSDFDKRNNIKDIAIRTEGVYIIPTSNRMSISLEFS